eukprot:g15917.t1
MVVQSEVDVALSKLETPEEALLTQRQNLEMKCRQAMSEYGQVQERLEISRHQQLCERQGDGAPAWSLSGAHETTLGRLLLSAGAASWQGNKDENEEVQEDRFLTDVELRAPGGQRIVGVIVFDGHSGSLCVDIMMDWLPRSSETSHLKNAVTEACVLTDDEFLTKAREKEALDGTTMILCLVWPEEGRKGKSRSRLLIANLGDSRAVICRQQGHHLGVFRLSDDHKPGRPDEQKRIEGNGGVVDMQGVWRVFTPGPATFGGRSLLWGLAVSRAFGDLLMKEPQRYGCTGEDGQYGSTDLRDRFLVLACDGIWDVLSDEEAITVCSEHKTADQAAQALARPTWSEKDLAAVEEKLSRVGVTTAEKLAELLSNGLNKRLLAAGQKAFNSETLAALRQRLSRESPTQDKDDCEQQDLGSNNSRQKKPVEPKPSEASFLLLEEKAIVNATNLLGETPLILATRASADTKNKSCRLSIVKLLLESRAAPKTPLFTKTQPPSGYFTGGTKAGPSKGGAMPKLPQTYAERLQRLLAKYPGFVGSGVDMPSHAWQWTNEELELFIGSMGQFWPPNRAKPSMKPPPNAGRKAPPPDPWDRPRPSLRPFYEVLGLPDGTKNHQVLKKAYRWCAQLSFALLQLRRVSKVRQAALKWHPDKNPNDPHAASNFQKACNAFEQICKALGLGNL